MKTILVPYDPYGPWDVEAQALAQVGGNLESVPYPELFERPRDAELLLNAWAGSLTADLLDAMPSLRCAVGYGVGLDWIDVPDASRRGIRVVTMPEANREEVATHTVALILACARRLPVLDQHVRGGGWDWPRSETFYRLRGRRAGLLAFGGIARRVVELLQPFGLVLAAHDPHIPDETIRSAGVDPVGLEELLRTSHILSVHVPATVATRNLLDARRLSLLPEGAIVVVTSRGEVYDPDALAAALTEGGVGAAGLDVFPEEPLPPDHALRHAPNVVLTPHVAGTSEESIQDLHQAAADVIDALARGVAPPGLVNPEMRA
jgi:phosphoglycerate dehydrogenase-like enzyme